MVGSCCAAVDDEDDGMVEPIDTIMSPVVAKPRRSNDVSVDGLSGSERRGIDSTVPVTVASAAVVIIFYSAAPF